MGEIDEKARDAAVAIAKEMVAENANHWEIADAVIEAYESAKPKEGLKLVKQIAQVSAAVGWQANVGASETAGLIVSVLAANPEQIDRFMAEGSELFIDGTMRAENGCLSHRSMNGQIVSPTKLREMKGQSQ